MQLSCYDAGNVSHYNSIAVCNHRYWTWKCCMHVYNTPSTANDMKDLLQIESRFCSYKRGKRVHPLISLMQLPRRIMLIIFKLFTTPLMSQSLGTLWMDTTAPAIYTTSISFTNMAPLPGHCTSHTDLQLGISSIMIPPPLCTPLLWRTSMKKNTSCGLECTEVAY